MALDKLIHKYLKIPYKLNYRHIKPRKAKSRATVVFLHGLASSSDLWSKIVNKLPSDINIVLVDLLGHGQSPKPDWLSYNLSAQARSLHNTLSSVSPFKHPVILVGHSLGSLVAIEYAKKYHASVDSLVLVAPPIYKSSDNQTMDKTLLKAYSALLDNTQLAKNAAKIVAKVATGGRAVESETDFVPLASSLRDSIIKQNSFNDIQQLDLPIDIIYGSFDPLVIGKNLREIAEPKPNVKVSKIVASHDVVGAMISRVLKTVAQQINCKSDTI